MTERKELYYAFDMLVNLVEAKLQDIPQDAFDADYWRSLFAYVAKRREELKGEA